MASPHLQNHLVWGAYSPLSSLSGGALIILASGRTAFAVVEFGALLWVFGASALIFALAQPVSPTKERELVFTSLCSVLGSLYLLLLFLACPVLALEARFFIMLTPVYAICSRFPSRIEDLVLQDGLIRAFSEALFMGSLILAGALIREPLGYGTLSIPGGQRGITELFQVGQGYFFPVRIFAVSAGVFFILGYGVAVYRYFRNKNMPIGENDE